MPSSNRSTGPVSALRSVVRRAIRRTGFDVIRRPTEASLALTHPDLEPSFRKAWGRVHPYSMTSVERLYAVWQAVRHVCAAGIPGDIVECGVWRGGSSMTAALALLEGAAGDGRDLWLYDTFEGMSEPSERDVAITGERMTHVWDHHRDDRSSELLCWASIDDVRANLASTGFPASRLHLIEGQVERTIPSEAPERIAVLRLDTDWYESTLHELEHLFPRLEPGGVLIVDDYGHWQGAREAVDEYVRKHDLKLLLQRTDYTGRMGTKA